MAVNVIRRNTVADALWRTARRVPDKPAIVCGEVGWSYAHFDAIVTRAALGLAASGVRPGDRIAVLSRNSHSFAVLRFAVARLGAVLVPINFMLLAGEVAHLLRHSGATRICVDSEFAPLGIEAAREAARVEQILWLPGEESRPQPEGTICFETLWSGSGGEAGSLDREVGSPSVAQIMYTSGTESMPKGVMLTHDAIMTQYLSCVVDLEIAEGDRVLHSLPMYHCAQLDAFFGPAVLVGAYNVITRTPEPERALRLIEGHRITSFFAPPTVWISLLRSPVFARVDLSSLQKGYYGASIMPGEILRELQRCLPKLRLWNAYGQTEIAPLAAVLKPEDQLRKAGSAGKPVIHVASRVVREDMTDVEVGEVGELVHRSPQLLSGYLDDPDKTAAAFAGGWFHSGDLAVMDEEGYITIVDRKKDMIKTGGENVSSREVEEAIYKLPGVGEVAVVGLPDPRWVEVVSAFIVLKKGAELSETDVEVHCAACLGAYKRPKRVFFTEELPKNASGKVMKRELRSEYCNRPGG